MLPSDSDAFARVMQDLCVAFNRPYTTDLSRVYWESMRYMNIAEVRKAAETARRTLRKFPTPKDLIPERRYAAPKPQEDEEPISSWAQAANQILMAVAYFDERRGFRAVGEWEAMPENGWGLPLRLPRNHGGETLVIALEVKADFVRMAEEDAARGQPWNETEFNRTCREGFEKLLRTTP